MTMDKEQKSQFIEQIVALTLERISENCIFDEKSLKRLQELADSSGFGDPDQVLNALVTEDEDEDETY